VDLRQRYGKGKEQVPLNAWSSLLLDEWIEWLGAE
jgi:hypothetical protein